MDLLNCIIREILLFFTPFWLVEEYLIRLMIYKISKITEILTSNSKGYYFDSLSDFQGSFFIKLVYTY